MTTSSGDQTLDVNDSWLVTDDANGSGDPSISMLIQGSNPSVRVSEIALNNDVVTVRWNPVSVPARGRVALVIFVAQNPNRAAAIAEARALQSFGPAARFGLSGADRVGLINF